ncbi:MAG TPA: CocE/NonD family hydrolase, partial [Aliiroseovarius sp.]|nr:CocE/NonD family hydrolase [Aliiroseovarius sp.]
MENCEIIEFPDVGITLSDGTRLSARVWCPADAEDNPVPAILEYLPYRKRDGTVGRDAITHPWMARRGYACVRVDIRGNGDSEGVMADEYSPEELADGVEIINWLAAQTWCTGKVGMMGISWGGFNALQIAALQPEPLKAIITLCSTADRYNEDIHYRGGCLLGENFDWGSVMLSYSSRAPDPDLVGEKWRDMWLERLEADTFLPGIWLNHQTRDEYWKHGSICEDYSAVKAATLAISGWGDAYKNTVPQLVENLSAPVKGINGPWMHKYPHIAAPEPRIGFLHEALRWWDHWLKGENTGVENDPDYRMFLMDGVRPKTWYEERAGRWIAEANWPVDRPATRLFFDIGGKLGEKAHGFSATVASPQHCGLEAGQFCAIWGGPELPGDQRADDAFSAVFCSEPLEEDADIAGQAVVKMTVTSDKPQAQVAVRLNHVHQDGASTRITYGLLNLTHRDGHAHPQPLTPGKAYEVTIPLDHIAYRMPRGGRLAVAISNAYWPLIWPSPEAGTLTISAGSIDLPVRPPAKGDEVTFEEPETDIETWEHDVIRPAGFKRWRETDMKTGLVTLHVVDDFGKVRDSDHGLVTGAIATKQWVIHPDDPNSARASTHWVDEFERGGLRLCTETVTEMWSDSQHFYLAAQVRAWEGEDLIFDSQVNKKRDR